MLAVVCIGLLVGAAAWAVSEQNALRPNPPTLTVLSAAQLTATQAIESTAASRRATLGVTMAAVLQVTPGLVPHQIYAVGTVAAPSSVPDFEMQNAWAGWLDGRWFGVYAGALRSDPQQGALWLVMVAPNRLDQQRFLTPLSHGALRITADNVQRLTLVSPDRTTYYFDVLARRFVSSLIEYADTATPPRETPTATPTPTMTATIGTPRP